VDRLSSAARAGLEAGDIITAVNRTAVSSVTELTRALSAAARPLALNVLRGSARIYIVVQ